MIKICTIGGMAEAAQNWICKTVVTIKLWCWKVELFRLEEKSVVLRAFYSKIVFNLCTMVFLTKNYLLEQGRNSLNKVRQIFGNFKRLQFKSVLYWHGYGTLGCKELLEVLFRKKWHRGYEEKRPLDPARQFLWSWS